MLLAECRWEVEAIEMMEVPEDMEDDNDIVSMKSSAQKSSSRANSSYAVALWSPAVGPERVQLALNYEAYDQKLYQAKELMQEIRMERTVMDEAMNSKSWEVRDI